MNENRKIEFSKLDKEMMEREKEIIKNGKKQILT